MDNTTKKFSEELGHILDELRNTNECTKDALLPFYRCIDTLLERTVIEHTDILLQKKQLADKWLRKTMNAKWYSKLFVTIIAKKYFKEYVFLAGKQYILENDVKELLAEIKELAGVLDKDE